jgi:hypothetical protein
MNIDNSNFKLGQQLFREGFKYHQINKHLGGTVNCEVYKGYENENRRTKCGFLLMYWNMDFSYQTSADLRTWFN